MELSDKSTYAITCNHTYYVIFYVDDWKCRN